MTLNELLELRAEEIIDNATRSLERVHAGKNQGTNIHQRIKALFVLTARGVKERNLGPMLAHAETIARERVEARLDLSDAQTAFNVLEEAIWVRVLKDMKPEDYAQALGLVSTVIGAGKDKLARAYVSLATKSHAPSLNMQSLFTGTEE